MCQTSGKVSVGRRAYERRAIIQGFCVTPTQGFAFSTKRKDLRRQKGAGVNDKVSGDWMKLHEGHYKYLYMTDSPHDASLRDQDLG